ncbi:MAG: putative transcriptional regulator containing an HTH domain fused to a Zn-ribbon [Haloquadratum walsbyi J07HQW2]|uniref:Putative transcriptional regulator containing an HTH domain fused to a Zn-ribbon n=1 Tax=Haloquadratum walsbyi J07HQW2 TaxID=1238425 RepID=U1NIF9_9EURY|nr:MAG: putative transcriptional regulator containing an HTH domain fused to a Zn-ribbon [Haloquadratum walsbyi J07HQW2]
MDKNNLSPDTEETHSQADSAHQPGSKTTTESESSTDDTVEYTKPTAQSDAQTTREHIRAEIRTTPQTASELGSLVNIPRSVVFGHVDHIARSVDSASDEQFLVAPPTCKNCGFDRFDDPINNPSRCPDCRSERISEPEFVIEPL